MPIELQVTGSFHQLAEFVSGIAALPRIVTIHDMKLSPFRGEDDDEEATGERLEMSAIAKTYRYLQEDEQ